MLFHFTRKLEYLKSILADGFHPRYCPEYMFGGRDAAAAKNNVCPAQAIPMVCFCDLPLALIGKHLKEYGNFGIGLTKHWGIRHGVGPVSYTHDNSQNHFPLSRMLWNARAAKDEAALYNLRMMTAYVKPIRGHAWRRGKVKSDVHFYDEREWRFVPPLKDGKDLFLPRDEYQNHSIIAAKHEHLKEYFALKIGPESIQYLIVPNEREVLNLAGFLKELYKGQTATLVTTAIMTTDCISDDI
ncbi:MAG TPA: abortive infection system antitoxin AbiGi family protein [Verrucomicrobiae bacterium]|nr:abortive infection system antitoxin AbiGi family protein [Verrucomicrobiae bacterium]